MTARHPTGPVPVGAETRWEPPNPPYSHTARDSAAGRQDRAGSALAAEASCAPYRICTFGSDRLEAP